MEKNIIVTTLVSVSLLVFGNLFKYINDIKITNRKDKLDRINRQLKELYGPLFGILNSSEASWQKFRETHRNDIRGYFDINNPPSDTEKEVWRNWMRSIFIPNNEKALERIINNSDLIIEDTFPECFENFCAHVETYRPVVKKWQDGDYSEHLALINYPTEIIKYVEKSYKKLKLEQKKLIK